MRVDNKNFLVQKFNFEWISFILPLLPPTLPKEIYSQGELYPFQINLENGSVSYFCFPEFPAMVTAEFWGVN